MSTQTLPPDAQTRLPRPRTSPNRTRWAAGALVAVLALVPLTACTTGTTTTPVPPTATTTPATQGAQFSLTLADGTFTVDGRERKFVTYGARGVSSFWSHDDGTITPMASAASLPFAPEVVLPAIREMKRLHGEHLWGEYGFLDAFNPTFTREDVPTPLGKVVPGKGWYATNYLGIDQGPIVLMIENQRSGLFWRLMRTSPPIVAGLRRAGFAGGWLEEASAR